MAPSTPVYGERLLPTVIDDIASTSPDQIYASVPHDDNDLSKGFKNITYDEFAKAIDGVSYWLDETLGKTDGTSFPTFAYFGPRDLGYAVVIVAAAKVGRKVLLASHLASSDAHVSLLTSLDCTAVVYATELSSLAQSLRVGFPGARYIATPSLCTWLTNPDSVRDNQRYVYDKAYSAAHADPVMVVHTSGTTGMPKPVIWTHDMIACLDRSHTIPGSTAKAFIGQSVYCALPIFHTSGISAALFVPVYLGTIIILGPAGTRPSKETVLGVLNNAPVSAAGFTPSLLEDCLNDPTCRTALKSLEKIAYGGAPIAAWADRILGAEFNGTAASSLGSTEGGLWLTGPAPDPTDRGYFLIHPFMSPDFQHQDADLYELVIRRTPQSETFTNFFRFLDGIPPHMSARSGMSDGKEKIMEFRTKDLFSPHPEKEGLWRYRCRKDDLVLLNGEIKMYAGAIEEAISARSTVGAAVVGGQQRSRPFLLVESATPVNSEEEKKEFVDKIWPAVEEENAKHFEAARLQRGLVIVAENGKKIVRTDKGSVNRKATLAVYESDIDELYRRWDKA